MITEFLAILIEDNIADAKLITHNLKTVPGKETFKDVFKVEWFENLSSGIDRIQKGDVDIILLDLSLPDSDGLQTFLKVQQKAVDIPIIVLTGLNDEKIALEAVHVGAQDYLVKNEVDQNLLFRSMRYAIERKRFEVEKEKMTRLLLEVQKLEAVGNLAGGIAHDFNNLMTTIQGFTDVLMRGLSKTDPSFRYLEQIRVAANNAAAVTSQMLLFSRKHLIKYVNLDLNKLIRNLLKMLNRVFGEDIDVETDLKTRLGNVYADKGSLEQLLINLAVHAKGDMIQGGKIIFKTDNVTIHNSESSQHPDAKPGHYVCLSMIETGIRIDRSILEHLFEPFYNIEGIGHSTGLGMAAVYGIIKQHHGWIDVVYELNLGTTFKIMLPVMEKIDKITKKNKTTSMNRKISGKRILFVEDTEGVREFVMLALTENGYDVLPVADGAEAMEVFEKENMDIDAVLSDVVLPDMSGIELIERLKEKKPSLQILLTSGYTDDKLKWPMIQEKGYRFLTKPFAYKKLLTVVRELFN